MIPLFSTVIAQYAIQVARQPQKPQALASFQVSKPSLQVFAVSAFLVSVPVFVQAPLVREWPWFTLCLTLFWLGLSWVLMARPKTHLWGDLLFGFSWSWCAGSIYWGWFRGEPLVHLPIEALGLPIALWGLYRGWGIVGHLFYLGSLFGTAITDAFFYVTGLIPYWRQVMIADPDFVGIILHNALAQIQTAWGVSWGVVLVSLLLGLGSWALRQSETHWWALAGAILSTILVDSLFWLAAILA